MGRTFHWYGPAREGVLRLLQTWGWRIAVDMGGPPSRTRRM